MITLTLPRLSRRSFMKLGAVALGARPPIARQYRHELDPPADRHRLLSCVTVEIIRKYNGPLMPAKRLVAAQDDLLTIYEEVSLRTAPRPPTLVPSSGWLRSGISAR
jgi:hypothetical protein